MTIIIDTREQMPWAFPEWVRTEIGTVRTGDYCLKGDSNFAVERKNFSDFLGTISTGWDRFCREIDRAVSMHFVLPIIVEGRLEDVVFHLDDASNVIQPNHDHPNLTPAFVLKRIAEIQLRGASVFFAERKEYAVGVAFTMLHQRYQDLESEMESSNGKLDGQTN